jgi:DNA-binding NarL/FixJ family response regulator
MDGVPAHNVLSNLRYGTKAQNRRDQKFHRVAKGHKFTPAEVEVIKYRLKQGDTQRGIARELGVASNSIANIAHGRSHADV